MTGNRVKNSPFRPSKHQKPVIFQDIYLTFCTHINLTGLFHIHFCFPSKCEKIPNFLENIIVDYYFSKFSKLKKK